MKLTAIIGLILGFCLLCFLRNKIPKFKITFTRVALICASCILIAFLALKSIIIIGIVSLAIFVIYVLFKAKAR